jgi:DNA-binding transcriptional ArsR family regulator
MPDDAEIEAELKGKTLLIYMHILKAGQDAVGVREIQRALSLSSPSVAAYHLQKLQEMGLIENVYGDYKLVREVKVGVLRSFVSFGGFMLPKFLFYAVLVTTMLATFVIQTPFEPTRFYITTLVMGVVPAAILWYETIKIWREKPK